VIGRTKKNNPRSEEREGELDYDDFAATDKKGKVSLVS